MLTLYFRPKKDEEASNRRRPVEEVQAEYEKEIAIVNQWEEGPKKKKMLQLLSKKFQTITYAGQDRIRVPKYIL